jgi:WD40 repeat protein
MDHTGLTVFNRFSQDGTKMATSSASGNTKIWDAHSMKLLYTIFPGAWEIIFSPDGTKFLAFSPNNAPSLWDVELGNPIDWPDNDIQGVYDAKFQTDGKKITLLLQSKNSVLIQTWSFSETIGNRLQKISQKDFRDLGIDLNDLQK